MLSVTAGRRSTGHATDRRAFLKLGAAGMFGLGSSLGLPDLLRAEGRAASDQNRGKTRVKSVILMFLEGGPAHQDTWDMKPDAPEQIRGEFRPIATSAPGILFCEHLPMLARQAHHLTLVRSVHHTVADHNAGAYFAMTGHPPFSSGKLVTRPSRDDFPPFGAVLARLQPTGRSLPDFVHTPDWMSNNGSLLPGQAAGFLGGRYDPFLTGDPSLPGYQVPGLELPRELSLDRVGRRRDLLDAVSRAVEPDAKIDARDDHYRKAFELISSPEARRAFDLSREPQSVRERYGLDPGNDRSREARKFGGLPQLGQSLLLTRRLIEAGVRLVTVCTGPRYDQTWDTHRDHFPLLKRSILPYFDRAFSALIADLHDRGLLAETLVVAVGEFGRTPRVGQITSDAGADKGGRDHWPHCYTALFAGGGMPAGSLYGASDAQAAHPARDPVTPEDIAATLYKAVGLDPGTTFVHDALGRPFALSAGTPIPLGG